MTDDLVKRLRDNCTCNFPDTPCGAEEECRNAFEGADRIEKLEAALRRLIDYGMVSHQDLERARKALEGKEDEKA